MFAVMFEVQPKAERWTDYLALAKLLRPEIEQIRGFIDNERYKSRRTEGRLLSLSTWADEKAVIRWRTHARHHGAQETGRFEIFQDYHLRVGEVYADTHVPPGQCVQQQRLDTTEIGAAQVATLSEIEAFAGDIACLDALLGVPRTGANGVVDAEAYASITTEGKVIVVVSWHDADAAAAWRPPAHIAGAGAIRHRHVRVIRDYGLADRREAPQYYAAVGETA